MEFSDFFGSPTERVLSVFGDAISVPAAVVAIAIVSYLVGRWKEVTDKRVDAVIDRHWRLLTFHVLIGYAAWWAQFQAAVAVVVLSAIITTVLAERRPRRGTYDSPKEFKRRERKWEFTAASVMTVIAIATGAVNWKLDQAERRNSHICLLLAFRPVSADQDPKKLERIWSEFCATWRDVFARVDGVTIFPADASEEEFAKLDLGRDRRRVLAHAAELKPSLVLETTVNVPQPTGSAVLLVSRVCTIERGDTKPTDIAFSWRGGATTRHTALQGAADLLRHLHTAGTPRLSAAQHKQASQNLLRSYSVVLGVTPSVPPELVASVERAKQASAPPMTDDQLAELLNAYPDAETTLPDAQKAQAKSRKADLAKLRVAR